VVFFGSEFEDSTLGSRDEPPHFVDGRRVDPVFRVAKLHVVAAHGSAHCVGIVARALPHAGTWHVESDGLGIAGRAEISGERFLHDDVFPASAARIANSWCNAGGTQISITSMSVRASSAS